jgi:hypothetical protein
MRSHVHLVGCSAFSPPFSCLSKEAGELACGRHAHTHSLPSRSPRPWCCTSEEDGDLGLSVSARRSPAGFRICVVVVVVRSERRREKHMLWPDPGHLADAGLGGWRWAVAGTDRGSPKCAAPLVLRGRRRERTGVTRWVCSGDLRTRKGGTQTTHANSRRVQD